MRKINLSPSKHYSVEAVLKSLQISEDALLDYVNKYQIPVIYEDDAMFIVGSAINDFIKKRECAHSSTDGSRCLETS